MQIYLSLGKAISIFVYYNIPFITLVVMAKLNGHPACLADIPSRTGNENRILVIVAVMKGGWANMDLHS